MKIILTIQSTYTENLFNFTFDDITRVFAEIRDLLNDENITLRTPTNVNVFDPAFITSKVSSLNSNFNIGTVQSVYYLNYPNLVGTTTGPMPSKLSGIAGIIILDVNTPVPVAYIITNPSGIGWSIASKGDRNNAQGNQEYINLTVLGSSMYVGKNTGPSNQNSIIAVGNTIIGDNSLKFKNHDRRIIYNTALGCKNNNGFLLGSYNVLVGAFNGNNNSSPFDYTTFTSTLTPQNLPTSKTSDFNVVLGNMILADNSADGGFIKQFPDNNNILIGNFLFRNAYASNKNIVIGNSNMVTTSDLQKGFLTCDNNIIIGNNILISQGGQTYQDFSNNMFIIPNKLNLESIILAASNSLQIFSNETENAIFIGTIGDATPNKDRSNTTYIANIYNKYLYQDVNAPSNKTAVGVPHTMWISHDSALVSPIIFDTTNAITSDALDAIITNELYTLPVFGSLFVSSDDSTFDSETVFYGIDANHIATNTLQYPFLKTFLLTYNQGDSVNNFSNHPSNAGDMAGFEHMHLIPLIIRALQLQEAELAGLRNRKNKLREKIRALIEKRKKSKEAKGQTKRAPALGDEILYLLSEYVEEEE